MMSTPGKEDEERDVLYDLLYIVSIFLVCCNQDTLFSTAYISH